jgi:hypothetical protein
LSPEVNASPATPAKRSCEGRAIVGRDLRQLVVDAAELGGRTNAQQLTLAAPRAFRAAICCGIASSCDGSFEAPVDSRTGLPRIASSVIAGITWSRISLGV